MVERWWSTPHPKAGTLTLEAVNGTEADLLYTIAIDLVNPKPHTPNPEP